MPQYTYGLTQLIGHGHAFTQLASVTKPAAGANLSHKPSGSYWSLVDSMSFQLVTSSTVADRLVTLSVLDGTGIAVATIPAASTQGASTTVQYTYLSNFSSQTGLVGGAQLSVFPGVFLQPDYTISVTVASIDTTDQLSNIRVYYQRFVTGDDGYMLGTFDLERDPLADLGELATFRS